MTLNRHFKTTCPAPATPHETCSRTIDFVNLPPSPDQDKAAKRSIAVIWSNWTWACIAASAASESRAVVGGRGGDGPEISVTRAETGQQLAGIGLDQIGQKGVSCGDGDLLVKAQVQLVIGIRFGVALGCGMDFAGADVLFQPCRARHRQTPRRQPGCLAL